MVGFRMGPKYEERDCFSYASLDLKPTKNTMHSLLNVYLKTFPENTHIFVADGNIHTIHTIYTTLRFCYPLNIEKWLHLLYMLRFVLNALTSYTFITIRLTFSGKQSKQELLRHQLLYPSYVSIALGNWIIVSSFS